MQRYKTIDACVAGESVRLLVEGAPTIVGRTMGEKLTWLRRHGEPLRKALMLEPRGHAGMHGALFTEPASAKAHAGLLSMHAGGFPLVSGEAVIAAVTMALENNIIVFDRERSDDLYIDTPAGLMTAQPHFLESTEQKGVAVPGVALAGLPGFVHTAGVPIPFGNRTVPVDIAFGGEFYAIADGESVGVPVDADHASHLLRAGLGLKQAVEAAITSMRLEEKKNIGGIQGVILTAPAREGGDLRSATILEGGVLKRSAGLTGTVALLAVLDAMGLVQDDRMFVHEGLIGTHLRGRIASRLEKDEIPCVVPVIEGKAWTTGRHEFIVENDDPAAFRI